MAVSENDDIKSLRHLLICPLCKGALHFSLEMISCLSCGLELMQSRNDFIDLLPNNLLDNDRSGWELRQQQMEKWYQELVAHPDWAIQCFINDYTSYSSLLSTLTGTVLDIGGGNGVIRNYLPESVYYISIDPSMEWFGNRWEPIAESLPCLKTPPLFVRGIGEYLPFPPNCLDAVLAFWSLNHAKCPATIFQETYRVLKPSGRLIVTLEDMPPGWLDVVTPTFLSGGVRVLAKTVKRKILCGLSGKEWPIEDDHIRISESEIQKWITGRFEITRRMWVKTYLTFDLRRF
jgi:SAM-dependent methyltransferase